MLNAAQEALKPGKDGENISYPDYIMIVDMISKGMLNQARMVLNYRLETRKKEAIKLQQENIRLTGEQGQKQQQMKNEAEAQKRKDELVKELVKGLFSMQENQNAEIEKMKTELLKAYLMPQQNAPAQQ